MKDDVAQVTGYTAQFSVSTENLEPGIYGLEVWATISGKKTLIRQTRLVLKASIATQGSNVDQRSQAERIVAAIEDYIERGAQSPNRRYRINNREIERYMISELLKLLDYYKRIAASEKRKRTGQNRSRILFKL
jgi:hypothetical protein